jgi:hypothetical protein
MCSTCALIISVFALAIWQFPSKGSTSHSTIVPPPQAAAYKLAFADDFNSLDLSPNGSGIHAWYESVWWDGHIPSRSLISISDSVLSLKWQRNQGSSDTSITTFAHDRTQGKTWRYGYFEASMKWDVVTGAWPAFWLIPAQDARGENIKNGVKETGEIDIFEGQGDHPNTFYGTIHDWVDKKHTTNTPNWFTLPGKVDFSAFHTYGLRWIPGKVTWYFDNRELYSTRTPAIVDKQDFFIVLGSQVGTNWESGSLVGVDARVISLSVDWVRVWQR